MSNLTLPNLELFIKHCPPEFELISNALHKCVEDIHADPGLTDYFYVFDRKYLGSVLTFLHASFDVPALENHQLFFKLLSDGNTAVYVPAWELNLFTILGAYFYSSM